MVRVKESSLGVQQGKTYGKWEVIGPPFSDGKRFRVVARCLCGGVHVVQCANLAQGTSGECVSCGRSVPRDAVPQSLGDGRMTIPLTRGYKAIIDESDWPLVEGYHWQVEHHERTQHCYAVGRPRNSPRGTNKVRMHRLIANAPDGMEVDHKDCNGLNNCRDNLRICNRKENMRNTRRRAGNYSRFKGVSFDKRRDGKSKPWCAQIKDNSGVKRNLGRFWTEEEAARAYDEAARLYFGEFARTNFA